MAYSKLQFIAYRLYTGPGREPDHYVGLDDPRADVALRVRLMSEAVRAAGDCALVDPSPDVLKVFVAPELYFRAKTGGYKDLTCLYGKGPGRDADSIVGALANAAQEARWQDWLFVFGTAMVENLNPGERETSGETTVLNLALVQKGGFSSEEERIAKFFVVRKRWLSGVDWEDLEGVSPKREDIKYFAEFKYFNGLWPRPYASEVNLPGLDGYGCGTIFPLDGMTFGLEICADHGFGRLRKATPGTNGFFIQVQLVPSSGTSISPAFIATVQGGIVFNVDGAQVAANDSRDGYSSRLCRVTSAGQPSTADDLKEMQPLMAVRVNDDLAELGKAFWLPVDDDRQHQWLPELAIYGLLDVPNRAPGGS